MDEREDDVISVTMSRNAAEKFKAALTFAECRLTPDLYSSPLTEKEKIAYDHTDWLRWGVGRVMVAEGCFNEPRRKGSQP
jgi:hypothetical protein